MVRVRESPTCAICEFVMKQLESMLEDQKTEVGCVRYTRFIQCGYTYLQCSVGA